jgi:hypothetical protein
LKSQPRREALTIMQATVVTLAVPVMPQPSQGGRRRAGCNAQGVPRPSEVSTARCRES